MTVLGKIRRALTRKKRPSDIRGAIRAVLPIQEYGSEIVELRAKHAARRGVAASTPRKKSKKQLRAEKDAMWQAKVREKRFEGAA